MTDSQANPATTTEGNAPADAPATPPAQPVSPPQQPATPTPATPRPNDDRVSGQALLDALNALPERIAHTIREATPKPATKSDDAGNDSKTDKGSAGEKTPQKKSFAERWFS